MIDAACETVRSFPVHPLLQSSVTVDIEYTAMNKLELCRAHTAPHGRHRYMLKVTGYPNVINM